MYKIIINNQKETNIEINESILTSLERNGVYLNYSCKNGRCKSCKVQLLEGETSELNAELGLTFEEKKIGFILTCVRCAQSDLRINVEQIVDYNLEPIRTIPAKINKIEKLNNDIIELELRIPPNSNFRYLSGQYVNLSYRDITRSYSIANSFINSENLTFYIKKYPNGKFSEYLFDHAKINDLLRIEGPIGTFNFKKPTKNNIVFLATSTGIAPVKSILEQINEECSEINEKHKIYLFYGVKDPADLVWSPNFENIKIEFYPVISRNLNNWEGCKGHVQNALLEKGINLLETEVYACGSVQMINEALETLIKNGLDEKFFFSDAFVKS